MVKGMKVLLPEEKGYKANLHCHTTGSDGVLTPEQMKKAYKDNGFSILAFTDHAYMEARSALNDENFVALSGYENHLEPTWIKGKPRSTKCYHLNFYSPDPKKVGMIGITDYYFDFCTKVYRKLDRLPTELLENGEYFKGADGGFGVKNLNGLLKQAAELGYFVVLNHPDWSRLAAEDICGIKGLGGVEIFNYGSFVGGCTEDEAYYDVMLRDGQKLYCFSNDDNHGDTGFGGYNVMYPEKLTYGGVFECMKSGKFYASTGAAIRGAYVDGNKVYVGAENAKSIAFRADGYSRNVWAAEKPLTHAEFELNESVRYFRIAVTDTNGGKAYTNAFFKEEL